MSDTSKKIAEKILKLLRLAEDQADKPEGQLAAVQARRLMEAHAVQASSIGADADPFTRVELTVKRDRWRTKCGLVRAIGEYCGGYSVVSTAGKTVWFYGRRSAVEVAEYLYTYLIAEIERRCDAHVKYLRQVGSWRVLDGMARHERASFCMSAAVQLAQRITAMQAAAQGGAAAECSMVLSRSAAARAYAESVVGLLTPVRGFRYYISEAGRQAGNDIQWNRAVSNTVHSSSFLLED